MYSYDHLPTKILFHRRIQSDILVYQKRLPGSNMGLARKHRTGSPFTGKGRLRAFSKGSLLQKLGNYSTSNRKQLRIMMRLLTQYCTSKDICLSCLSTDILPSGTDQSPGLFLQTYAGHWKLLSQYTRKYDYKRQQILKAELKINLLF